MRIYHVTTLARWQSIKKHGLVPGGLGIESEADVDDRRYAGDIYCTDSQDVVCLTLQPDGRYGGVVLRVSLEGLDPQKITYISGDSWDPDSRSFATFEAAVEDLLNRRGWGAGFDEAEDLYYARRAVEIRYKGAIPRANIRRVNYSWGV